MSVLCPAVGGGGFCKSFQGELFTALLECRPSKRVDVGIGAGGLVVSICNPSCMLLEFELFISFFFISFADCGSQTVAEYSSIGRTTFRFYMLFLWFSYFRFLGFF